MDWAADVEWQCSRNRDEESVSGHGGLGIPVVVGIGFAAAFLLAHGCLMAGVLRVEDGGQTLW